MLWQVFSGEQYLGLVFGDDDDEAIRRASGKWAMAGLTVRPVLYRHENKAEYEPVLPVYEA